MESNKQSSGKRDHLQILAFSVLYYNFCFLSPRRLLVFLPFSSRRGQKKIFGCSFTSFLPLARSPWCVHFHSPHLPPRFFTELRRQNCFCQTGPWDGKECALPWHRKHMTWHSRITHHHKMMSLGAGVRWDNQLEWMEHADGHREMCCGTIPLRLC